MADMNYAGIIRAATSLNQCEKYADGSDKYEIAGKLIIYFNNEPAAESVEIPIIFDGVFDCGKVRRNGVIIIGRNGRCRREYEEAQVYD